MFKKFLKTVLNSYSEILFLRGYVFGFLILCITFLDPNIGFSGLIAIISAFIFARFMNMTDEFLNSGFYTYNATLVGLSIGYLFKISLVTVFFIMISSVLTLILSIMISGIFGYYFKLPILSIPFVIVSSFVYLATSDYYHLLSNSIAYHTFYLDIDTILPLWLLGFFKSFGAVFFLPNALVGIVLSLIVLYSSRILFLLAITGYYLGVYIIGVLNGSMMYGFTNLSSFNFILIAMAVGGVFLIPSLKSYILAFSGVVVSVIVLTSSEKFWAIYGLPVFTLPFNFITLSLVYVFSLLNFPLAAKNIKENPEKTLDLYLTNKERFKDYLYPIKMPFSGRWSVWQGMNGKWTHKGKWAYAYDFVIKGRDDKTYTGEGKKLNDYLAYRKPILSPVNGTVVNIVDNIKDNEVGITDSENNWGNHVIVYDNRGIYVNISHFACESIKVKPGDIVNEGTLLGLCGNSGYSPQPHIHIQIQYEKNVDAATAMFSFSGYIHDEIFHSFGRPEEGSMVESLFPDNNMKHRLAINLGDTFEYDVYYQGNKIDELSLTSGMTSWGKTYLEGENSRIYFENKNSFFYCYDFEGKSKIMKSLFSCISHIPLLYKQGLSWSTALPYSIIRSRMMSNILLLIASFHHNLKKGMFKGNFRNNNEIKGKICYNGQEKEVYIRLDDKKGFKKIINDKYEFRLKKSDII